MHFICNLLPLVFHYFYNICRTFSKIYSASSTPADHFAVEYTLSGCHHNSHAICSPVRLCYDSLSIVSIFEGGLTDNLLKLFVYIFNYASHQTCILLDYIKPNTSWTHGSLLGIVIWFWRIHL